MNIKIVSAIAFTCMSIIGSIANAQKFNALNIGDPVPDVELKMLDYKTKTAHLSDFKGKLLILDFWSDWCTVCIAQFSRLDSLQQKFGDKICILPVGFDYQPGSIESFRKSRKGTKREMKMPTAVQAATDSAMMQLFPYQGLPNEVWINENGILIAITDHLAVNQQTISKQLYGMHINVPQKMYNSSFDWQKPLLTNNNGARESAFSFRSIIVPYLNTIPSFLITVTNEKGIHLAYLNTPVLNMLKAAAMQLYPEFGFQIDPLNKKVLIEVFDSVKQNLLNEVFSSDYLPMEAFKHKSFYTYEAVLPGGYTLKDAYTLMLNELETYFKVQVRVQNKEINCLALIRTSTQDKLHTDRKNEDCDASEDYLEYDCPAGRLDNFVTYINNNYHLPYVTNETGYEGNAKLHISVSNLSDLAALRKELNRYDLDLIEKRTNVNVMVITDFNVKQ